VGVKRKRFYQKKKVPKPFQGEEMASKVIEAMSFSSKMTRRLFTATNILFEAQRVRYNSPSARSQRKELRLAGEELGEAFSDWTKFIEVLSSIADKFKVRA
jgi:hypothetical protein